MFAAIWVWRDIDGGWFYFNDGSSSKLLDWTDNESKGFDRYAKDTSVNHREKVAIQTNCKRKLRMGKERSGITKCGKH